MSIYLLVADFVGIHKLSEKEQRLIASADGFLVTSNLLRKAYLDNYQINSIDLLHDLPDLDQHSRIRNTNTDNVPKKIIWVGNSKWGERLGFKDHKGLNKLAIPVFNILKTLDKNIEIRIIDSADSRIENSRVLDEIQEAACLLVTSDSEGTALPILEAAALGTPVVSVDVGIAGEILTGELSDQIVNRDPEYIAGRIIETIRNRESISPLFQKNWEVYKSIAEVELENLMYNLGMVGLWRRSKPKNQIVPFIVWLLRRVRS
jgi:glycosyltransferase involved in cell wall biosynthesis